MTPPRRKLPIGIQTFAKIRKADYTNRGRIDMTVKFGGHIYLFEFKAVGSAPEGQALRQLKDKGYAEKYRAGGLPIHLIGVEFSREKRNVVGFEMELAIERDDAP